MKEINKAVWKPKTIERAYSRICSNKITPETFYKNNDVRANVIIKALDIQSTDIVLDVGCGVGRLARVFTEHCTKVYGIDITTEMIDFCKQEMIEYITAGTFEPILVEGSSYTPIKTESIDKAYSWLVFQHNTHHDQYNMLKEIHRVLVKGGLFYVNIPDITVPAAWESFLRIAKLSAAGKYGEGGMIHEHIHPEEFKLYCDKIGFEVISIDDTSRLLKKNE